MSHWYFYVAGRKKGPVSLEQLLAEIAGRDLAAVLVWRPGLAEWKPALELPEINPLAPPLPPPAAVEAQPQNPVAEAPPVSRPWRFVTWSKVGTLGGFVILLVQVSNGRIPINDAAYVAGYIAGSFVICALIGFVLGGLVDVVFGRPKPRSSFVDARLPTGGRQNVVARHWRGDLPLWAAYWVVGLVVTIVAGIISAILGAVLGSSAYNPTVLFSGMITLWSLVAGLATWQLVGLWRSATKYNLARAAAGRHRAWGYLAQIAVVFGVLGNVVVFLRDGGPQLAETYRMAVLNDPGIPDYTIRVMRDRTQAEISGGFKYGLTNDFIKVLDANRIRVVHLDSVGGRVGEAEKLFKLIRARGLDTYVSSKCLSALHIGLCGRPRAHDAQDCHARLSSRLIPGREGTRSRRRAENSFQDGRLR